MQNVLYMQFLCVMIFMDSLSKLSIDGFQIYSSCIFKAVT